MNKRISALEDQLKIQKENLNKMSTLANKKEEKLNYYISKYQKQINDLKNELEQLNSTITNLTEEKENNTIKLTEFSLSSLYHFFAAFLILFTEILL